ncbi:hypothetical protein JG688_00018176 [Phytophthora aleatoria]|uniref:Uncharacterized protein n=1 Tax=Phytophthora aleatoria TaxID=2496075 RepID=A0A8J5M0T7_9STRA|nr:hypothetical protein JG688_00018176 [Phytophthora aleatoria]
MGEIDDELLEEGTKRALSQSRSEARHRSHATPSRHPAGGSGEPPGGSGDPDDDEPGAGPSGSGAGPTESAGSGSPAGGSGSHPSGSPGSVSNRAGPESPGVNPSGSSGSGARSAAPNSSGGAQGSSTPRSATAVSKSAPAPDLLPESPFGRRLQPRQPDATAIAPWAAEKLNRVAIVAMKIGILFPDLPLKTGWIFPHEGEDVPLTDYHDDLVTQPPIESLMAAKPWEILSTNSGSAISLHTDVGGADSSWERISSLRPSTGWHYGRGPQIFHPSAQDRQVCVAGRFQQEAWESPQPRRSRLEEDSRDLHPHHAGRLVRFGSSLGSLLPSPSQASRQSDLVPRCGISSSKLGGSDSTSIRTCHLVGSPGRVQHGRSLAQPLP